MARHPGLWIDELATWGVIRLSWDDLWLFLRQSDAALAPYYLMMRGWTAVAGDSDVALRLPSVIAMAGAAGLVHRVGDELAGARVGLLAGLAFVALPVTSRYAQEARPYAFAVLAATGSTLLLIRLLRRPRTGRLLGYGVVVGLLGLAHPLALLVLAAHGVVVVALCPAVLARWAPVALVACVPAVPLVWWGYRQRDNVAWIASSAYQRPAVFLSALFGASTVAAVVIALALPALVRRRRPAVVAAAWALVPAVALLVAGRLTVSVWLPRYLMFVVPAWLLLAALTIERGPRAAGLAVVALIAVLGLPEQARVRAPDGHYVASRQAGAIISAGARAGDAVLYSHDPERWWVPRDLVAHYVPPGRRPSDVLAVRAQRTGGTAAAVLCADVLACLGDTGRVWVLQVRPQPGEDDPLDGLDERSAALLRGRYAVDQVWRPTGLTIALLVRSW